MNKLLIEFLEMLDFSRTEAEELYPDWAATIDLLGLEEQDVRFAKEEWIPQHWDISIKGVRLCIGAYIRELIEIGKIKKYKERGIKVIYGISPSQPPCYSAIKIAGGEKVAVMYPDFLLSIVLGGFFNKLSLFTEDDSLLSERCRHCALNRTRINSSVRQVIPEPDVIWTWKLFCDEAAKTEELIQCLTDNHWDYIASGIPHDACLGEHEDKDPERITYLGNQFREGHRQIEEITGIEIQNKHVYAAIKEYANYTRKLDRLTRMVTNTDPQPVGGNELALFGTTISLIFNSGLTRFEEAIDSMIEEVAVRIQEGKGILPKGSPRMGCHFTPICVPWVDRLFRQNGVAVSFSSHVSFFKHEFLPFDYADPYQMLAQLWLRHPNSVNLGYHIELMVEMLKEYDIDAMLYGFFSFDRWLGSYQSMTLKEIEEQTGVRHFYIEGDFWEDRNYKKTDRKGRIESIAYFLKSNKLFTDANYSD